MLESMLAVLGRVAGDVWHTFAVNWPYLLLSVLVASALSVYVGADRLQSWLRRRVALAIVGVVIVAAVTPFCSCGTTAVVLGAMAAHVPWAPVVAFMVSSPLTSPEEYVLATGLFGFSFSTTFYVAAIVIGLVAGAVTHVIERTGWLRDQARMRETVREEALVGATPAARPGLALDVIETPVASSSCCGPAELQVAEKPAEPESCCGPAEPVMVETPSSCCGPSDEEPPAVAGQTVFGVDRQWLADRKLDEFGALTWKNSKRLALYFFGFAALGYLLIELIPTSFLTDYLGNDSVFAVPLAAILGIPIYLNTDASLPLVSTLMHGGLGAGPALAFLMTGAGTSIGAIGGMLLIARRRVVGLVIGSLLVGGIVLGYLAPIWL
ncbi:permease [Microbispora sp. RL4-1S]|uniref:Permease n=1 Tax=Microbispora oryzae TaxID=2806554 RepID=A0A940WMN3_9ACTN|nr:permease [Microbispora oryzae]MBP2704250.1 permease [Microbispora oryzae]